jgi:outer membrane protein assembly factor BamB
MKPRIIPDLASVFAGSIAVAAGWLLVPAHRLSATDDWPQFRGPAGAGKSDSPVPLEWSDTRNIKWKTALPGPGASSPIVHGGRIFLTCFTGFGTSGSSPADMEKLERHLLCLNLNDGKIVWDKAVKAKLPEQEKIREDHGYASATPVTDGERVFCFFGKSGVFAFDRNGQQLWQADVGEKLNGWGSAASPVLHGDTLLVNASVESESLVALDKLTGREVWRAGGINDSWHAPAIAKAPDGKNEIIVAIIRKVLGIDPANGNQLWECDTGINWYMCPTPVVEGGLVYAIGGRKPNGGLAVRAGGRGDVTGSHVVWKTDKGSNVPSPILHDGHLYYADDNRGVVYCVDAKTGDMVYSEELAPSPGQIYASPVLAAGRLYFTGRGGRTAVVAAKPKFNLLASNVLESGRGVFNATPALSGKNLLIRSNKFLYCIAQ